MQISLSKNWLIALLTLALIASIATFASVGSAREAMVVAPPAGIATIDLEKVFNTINERTDRLKELQAYQAQLKAELDKLKADSAAARAAAEAMSGAEREAQIQRAAELEINASVRERLYETLLDRRTSELFRGLYLKIAATAKAVSEKSGYSMVLASDEGVEIPQRISSQDIQRVISLRRFVYTNPQADITQQLIDQLNSDYAAGKR
jgi:Skp family chaperone for outer membrane proteins